MVVEKVLKYIKERKETIEQDFNSDLISEKVYAALTSELERIEKIIETKDPTKKENLPHKDFRCYMGWREPPLGTGEASVVVVPLDDEELTDQQLTKLMEALKVSHFSEETIDFRIQELDP